jgi:hypothetical protein
MSWLSQRSRSSSDGRVSNCCGASLRNIEEEGEFPVRPVNMSV